MRQGRKKRAQPVDVHVSMRVRKRRIELGLTQRELAAELGITVQHLYNFEKAKTRISAARLYSLSNALGVPVTFFFKGIAKTEVTTRKRRPKGG